MLSSESSFAVLASIALIVCLIPVVSQAQVPEEGPSPEPIERDKIAQTGMKFLQVSLHPRAAALGNAMTAVESSSGALFYNPATMARLENTVDLMVAQNQWLGQFSHNGAAAAYAPADGRYGVVGVSLLAVDYGSFQETIRADNDRGYRKIGSYSPSAMAVGLGYARALTDRFAVGGHLKLARQDLGSAPLSLEDGGSLDRRGYAKNALVVDFGISYETGFRSLKFAMSVRNFSKEYTYAEQSFELPLRFQTGLSMNMVDVLPVDPDRHDFLLSVDTIRPRDFDQQVRAGGEYVFMNTFSIRGGYIGPSDLNNFNLGAGIDAAFQGVDFSADYSYTSMDIFSDVNRLALSIGL